MKKMILAAALLSAVPFLANAQSVRSGSTSGAQAVAIIDGYGAGNPSGGGTTRNRVINNPDLGSLATVPTAPCVVPTGGSGSGGGIGLSLLFGLKDRECEQMRQVEMARVLGGNADAIEVACTHFPEYRQMRARTGQHCIADRPAPTPVVASMAPPARVHPDWCFTTDRSVLARPECRG